MSAFICFEDAGFIDLLPMVYWRSVPELRTAGGRLLDQIAARLPDGIQGLWTRDWIAEVTAERLETPVNKAATADTVLINARWRPNSAIEIPKPPFVGICDDQVALIACDSALARRLNPSDVLSPDRVEELLDAVPRDHVEGTMVRHVWDLMSDPQGEIAAMWRDELATSSSEVPQGAVLIHPQHIHLGPNVRIDPGAVIDARSGPVFLHEGSVVCPQAYVAGPAVMGPHATINPFGHLKAGCVIGEGCKVGGEVAGCHFLPFSNKQHEGFLGNSYVGSWVNLGAGTVNSNLKNTYGTVRVPIFASLDTGRSAPSRARASNRARTPSRARKEADDNPGTTSVHRNLRLPESARTEVRGSHDTGRQFWGAIIGDHVKTGIGTRIPTGCVIGAAATVMCSAMLPKRVGSFAWITDQGAGEGDAGRLAQVADMAMQRRGHALSTAESRLFSDLPTLAAQFEATS